MREEIISGIIKRFLRQSLVFMTWFVGYVERHPNKDMAASELAEFKTLLARFKSEVEEAERDE